MTASVTTDPVVRSGRFGAFTLTRVRVTEVVGRGQAHRTRVPVLVIGDESWAGVQLGAGWWRPGGWGPPTDRTWPACCPPAGRPRSSSGPGELFAGAAAVRAGIRASVPGPTADARALVPALVVGDDQQMSAQVVEDFRTCGLTHLAAVSGTNLTLVVGFLLVLARWAGVRARGLVLVGAVGVLGFVLLARPEPSVLRAAAMGSVALLGMGSPGRDRGVRTLGVAVLVLLLVDPWLALSVGFALSSLATAGILFLGPPFRDALRAWLPRWAAEALAVPFAAQLACTPLVAAVSGQVSLVAVVANLVVAAAVAPATVFGLVGGLLVLLVPPLGEACGWVAGGSAWWIITVATRLARLPTAAVDWSAGALSLTLLLPALPGGRARRRPGAAQPAVVGRPVRGAGRRDAASAAHPGLAATRLGASSPATWARATAWCSTPARQRGRGRHRTGPAGDAAVPRSARCRAPCLSSCSPTSTRTTSTGCRPSSSTCAPARST